MPPVPPRRVLRDSVTEIDAADAGAFVVTGSHAGLSVVRYACAVPLWAVAFNDAGIGKDGAGIAALVRLQAHGVAALAVAHDSARIGEAADTWAHGVVSAVNVHAAALGWAVGQRLCAAADAASDVAGDVAQAAARDAAQDTAQAAAQGTAQGAAQDAAQATVPPPT